MDAIKCGRCGSPRDIQANFCSNCGHQLTVNLPVARPNLLPVRPQRLPAAFYGSVAVLAFGTTLEWLARRLAGPAARAAGRALISQGSGRSNGEDVTVDEVLYVRKVQLRR